MEKNAVWKVSKNPYLLKLIEDFKYPQIVKYIFRQQTSYKICLYKVIQCMQFSPNELKDAGTQVWSFHHIVLFAVFLLIRILLLCPLSNDPTLNCTTLDGSPCF